MCYPSDAMENSPAPEPTRFTLRAAPGYAVSTFALGLFVLMAAKTAKAGVPYSFTTLSTDSGVHINTVMKVLKAESTFDVSTLTALSVAVGRQTWEGVILLGQRVALLVEGQAIDRAAAGADLDP